jgi:hypothetical protein
MGLNEMDKLVRVSVSPVCTVFDAVSAAEFRNVPAVFASHTLMCVTTSPFVPAHDAHDGVLDIAIDPADAAENDAEGLVVTELAAVAPAEPGSAVCSLMKLPAGAVDATARCMWSNILLA